MAYILPNPLVDRQRIVPTSIDELRRDSLLWYKLHVFIYDLRHFRSNVYSRNRLQNVVDVSYIGLPYFDAAESEKIKNALVEPATGRTLQRVIDDFFVRRLQERLKNRMAESGEYKVCASHDLAPMFEKAFDVKPKELAMDSLFLNLVNKGGLTMEDGKIFRGVGKRK